MASENSPSSSSTRKNTTSTFSKGDDVSSSKSAPPRGAVIPVDLTRRSYVYTNYMPFLRYGGVFIKTSREYTLGTELFLLLNIKGDDAKTPVSGKVAWITPEGAQGNRPRGIGVEFNAEDGPAIAKKLEKILGEALRSKTPTHTM